jgi:hypothetical protein
MASIRTGLIGVTVLAFVALESCSSTKNDEEPGPARTGGSAGTGVVMSGGTSTGAQGGAVGTGGYYPPGTLSCSNKGTCAHPFCTNDAALNKNCAPCAYEVCAIFPLCCTAMWDANCMLQAQNTCSCSCGVGIGGAPPSTGGRSTGGGGTAGTKTGGAGGGAGVSIAGQGGTAEAGAGGDSTDGGSAPGGADTGGAPASGGSGGAGGSGAFTLAEACTVLCATTQDTSLADCQLPMADCETSCTINSPDPATDTTGYPEMVQCLAELAVSEWFCSSDQTDGKLFGAIPVADGSCETEVCFWTCNDMTMADPTAIDRCRCL